jgi:hypothetical protein
MVACAFIHPKIAFCKRSSHVKVCFGPFVQAAVPNVKCRLLAGQAIQKDFLHGLAAELEGLAEDIESALTTIPSPREQTELGPPDSPQAVCPQAADKLGPSQGGTSSPQTTELVSPAAPDRGQRAGEQGCMFPNGGSHVGRKRGCRAAQKVWACACCGTTAKALGGGKLQECTRCRAVRYCGKECQVKHWPVHKAPCKGMHAAGG